MASSLLNVFFPEAERQVVTETFYSFILIRNLITCPNIKSILMSIAFKIGKMAVHLASSRNAFIFLLVI